MKLSIIAIISISRESFNLEADDASIIITFLGILVTLLVAFNVFQYVYAERAVRRIVRKETNYLEIPFACRRRIIIRCSSTSGT